MFIKNEENCKCIVQKWWRRRDVVLLKLAISLLYFEQN
jgi:hypothetical protein